MVTIIIIIIIVIVIIIVVVVAVFYGRNETSLGLVDIDGTTCDSSLAYYCYEIDRDLNYSCDD